MVLHFHSAKATMPRLHAMKASLGSVRSTPGVSLNRLNGSSTLTIALMGLMKAYLDIISSLVMATSTLKRTRTRVVPCR